MAKNVPVEALTDAECERLRTLVRERGEREALAAVGLRAPEALFKAAAGLPVARLTAELVRMRLGALEPAPRPAPPVLVEAAIGVPLTKAERPTPRRAEDGTTPRYRTINRKQGELADFCRLDDAERALRIDARACAIVEIASGEIVRERPRKVEP